MPSWMRGRAGVAARRRRRPTVTRCTPSVPGARLLASRHPSCVTGTEVGHILHVSEQDENGESSFGGPMRPVERRVQVSMELSPDSVMPLVVSSDENLTALERALEADIHVRGNAVTLTGTPADVAL